MSVGQVGMELPNSILAVRIVQFLLAIAILGMSGYGIYWVVFGAWCIALFTSLTTFIITMYHILTTKVRAWNNFYNAWAILGLDIFSVIFWLSSMAALGDKRASFKYNVQINGCTHVGGVGGGVCYRKRGLSKRAVATYSYLDMMSASAGLSALELILFVATLIWISIHIHRARTSSTPKDVSGEKGNSIQMGGITYSSVQQQAPMTEYQPQSQFAQQQLQQPLQQPLQQSQTTPYQTAQPPPPQPIQQPYQAPPYQPAQSPPLQQPTPLQSQPQFQPPQGQQTPYELSQTPAPRYQSPTQQFPPSQGQNPYSSSPSPVSAYGGYQQSYSHPPPH